MKPLEVGMRITTSDQQTYRILAVINQGQQVLGQPESGTTTVQVIKTVDIVQLTEQEATNPDVELDDVTVVGERYVDDIDHSLGQLQTGEAVLLQREADNQYDENAISVWTQRHTQLGYVARYQNQAYAELLDQGQTLYGVVSELDREQQRLKIQLWRTGSAPSLVPAVQIRQRVTVTTPAPLTTMPAQSVTTPLGTLVVTCNGRPIRYQTVPLSPWLTPEDELFVTKRFLITPDWTQVEPGSVVACQTTATAQVVQRWQTEENGAVVLTNADSFYVVGLSAQTMTGANDNLAADATTTAAFYRVGDRAAHERHGFMVSWAAFGEPHAQPALRAALQFPAQPVVPYLPMTATQTHATFTQQELAALLVSGLPNYQGGTPLEPSVSDLTVEKLRVTLGDQAYHALAGYRQRVQLLAGTTDELNETLIQALIHAVIYHEIMTLHYYQPTVGMVTQPVYPIQLFSTTTKDDEETLVGCLAFYNYDTFELQQVPLSAIASVAVIAQPEHPQTTGATPNPDWRQIFLHSWNDDDLD